MIIRSRQPNRLRHFDYSQNGWYFVTVCTKNREEHFGRMNEGKMILNELGIIAHKYWLEIPNHYSEVMIDEFAIMPNHIHGIIIISGVGTGQCPVPTKYPVHTIRIKYGAISKIINAYKNIVTKTIRGPCSNYKFQWQRSFYDHIIRNEKSLSAIREYIHFNPLKWDEDEENPNNS